MAHFARLDENNMVVEVQIVQNYRIIDENGNEDEDLGIQICNAEYKPGIWKQASYNGNFRGVYPGIGSYYIPEMDTFTYKKSEKNLVLDENTLYWIPPIPMPTTEPPEGFYYDWNDELIEWQLFEIPQPSPITINEINFRNQLTLTEKLLWDNPDSASTLSQKAVINTFKLELPLTTGEQNTTELLDLLVSEGVYTQQRLDEIISNL